MKARRTRFGPVKDVAGARDLLGSPVAGEEQPSVLHMGLIFEDAVLRGPEAEQGGSKGADPSNQSGVLSSPPTIQTTSGPIQCSVPVPGSQKNAEPRSIAEKTPDPPRTSCDRRRCDSRRRAPPYGSPCRCSTTSSYQIRPSPTRGSRFWRGLGGEQCDDGVRFGIHWDGLSVRFGAFSDDRPEARSRARAFGRYSPTWSDPPRSSRPPIKRTINAAYLTPNPRNSLKIFPHVWCLVSALLYRVAFLVMLAGPHGPTPRRG